jgi:hypothetical protein
LTISPIQRLMIKYLASGMDPELVASRLQLPVTLLKSWTRRPEIETALVEAVQEHEDLVEAMLLAGEREAANTLIEALGAMTEGGKPAWRVRVTAALSLLDRAGMRGRALEKQQIQQTVLSTSTEDVLKAALRDPSVRAWISTDEKFAPLLREAEVVEAEVVPTT